MKLRHLFPSAALVLIAASFPIAVSAVPYDVNSLGTLVGTFGGNTPNGPGTFYKYESNGSEEGTASSIFAGSLGSGGKSAVITWTGGQPILEFLYLKASNKYVLWNISNFNSGIYDSITVGNLGLITNKKGVSQGISHVQVTGNVQSVPDGASTLMLVGLALGGLAIFNRRQRS